jgi:hypothetical protein
MPRCPLCSKDYHEALVFPADVVVTTEIRSRYPGWRETAGVCARCLAEVEKRVAS